MNRAIAMTLWIVPLVLVGCNDSTPQYPGVYEAIVAQDYEAVQWFIDNGADIDQHGEGNQCLPPLVYVVGMGDYRMARLLLENGADTEAHPCEDFLNVMVQRAIDGSPKAIKWFEDSGVSDYENIE